MKNTTIVQIVLCVLLLCCFSIGTAFSQRTRLTTPTTPPPSISNAYHPNQLIIQIDKTRPSGNLLTGVAAFTRLGGVSRGVIRARNQYEIHLVEFDFNSRDKYFNSLGEAHDFYECGEGIAQLDSGIKRVKVRGSDYNYVFSVVGSDIPGVSYNLQNYIPYDDCEEPYLGLPTVAACNNLVVASVDSGCEQQTPFDNQVLFGEGYDFVDNDPFPYDEYGHGTRVLSIVAGETNNNAMNIDYLPVRVLDEVGEGDLWTFFKGLDFAIDQADIIIISLQVIMLQNDYCTSAYEAILAKAVEGNRLIVAAAGNAGLLIDQNDYYFVPASSPSENLIVVGGSSCFQQPVSFSNYGPVSVDIFAPTENILVYPPALATGTSFAAPQIASVAAIAGLTHPEFDASYIKNFILDNVIDRSWSAYSVTGGTFDYSTAFDICPAGLYEEETEEALVLPDFSMSTYFSGDNLGVSIHAETEQKANLEIIHLSGAVLAEKDFLLIPGKNDSQINTTQLPAGIYLISLKVDNGTHLLQKVVKYN